jgi:hypothetical protein
MNAEMYLLGDPLRTLLIQTSSQLTGGPYLIGRPGFIDNPDHQWGNSSVWTRTWTRSGGLPLLLTPAQTAGQFGVTVGALFSRQWLLHILRQQQP